METPKTAEFAHIGKSVIIKENFRQRGSLRGWPGEGSIELSGNRLIIGPHGQVRANVNAKGVINFKASWMEIFAPASGRS
jgi:hypothetical protein